ncbi:metal-dependent transcriptional regulator [Gordonia sp. NPDC003376]
MPVSSTRDVTDGSSAVDIPTVPMTPALEAYLWTIYTLVEDGVVPRRVRISERLGQAGPTVTQTVARLTSAGLVSVGTDHHVRLTDLGLRHAVVVARRHRLAERMLTEILGMPAQAAHAEALRWQHVLTEDVERSIAATLDDPRRSPWGNPVPGLDLLGFAPAEPVSAVPLVDLGPPGTTVTGTVTLIAESGQDDVPLMDRLISAGIIPGARVTVRVRRNHFEVRGLDVVDLPRNRGHVLRVDTGAAGPSRGSLRVV